MSFNHAIGPIDTIYMTIPYMFICTARRPIAPDAFGARTGRHEPFGNEGDRRGVAVARARVEALAFHRGRSARWGVVCANSALAVVGWALDVRDWPVENRLWAYLGDSRV